MYLCFHQDSIENVNVMVSILLLFTWGRAWMHKWKYCRQVSVLSSTRIVNKFWLSVLAEIPKPHWLNVLALICRIIYSLYYLFWMRIYSPSYLNFFLVLWFFIFHWLKCYSSKLLYQKSWAMQMEVNGLLLNVRVNGFAQTKWIDHNWIIAV